MPLADEQHYATADFTFVPKSGNPDNSIRRVGFYAGRIEDPDASESSHYYVKWNYPGAISVLEKIKWTFNNSTDDRDDGVNSNLNTAIINYSSALQGIFGGE